MVWIKANLSDDVNRNLSVYAAERDLTKQEAAAMLIERALDNKSND